MPVPRTGSSPAAAAALESVVAHVAAAGGVPVTLARGCGGSGGGGRKRSSAGASTPASAGAAPCAPASNGSIYGIIGGGSTVRPCTIRPHLRHAHVRVAASSGLPSRPHWAVAAESASAPRPAPKRLH